MCRMEAKLASTGNIISTSTLLNWASLRVSSNHGFVVVAVGTNVAWFANKTDPAGGIANADANETFCALSIDTVDAPLLCICAYFGEHTIARGREHVAARLALVAEAGGGVAVEAAVTKGRLFASTAAVLASRADAIGAVGAPLFLVASRLERAAAAR